MPRAIARTACAGSGVACAQGAGQTNATGGTRPLPRLLHACNVGNFVTRKLLVIELQREVLKDARTLGRHQRQREHGEGVMLTNVLATRFRASREVGRGSSAPASRVLQPATHYSHKTWRQRASAASLPNSLGRTLHCTLHLWHNIGHTEQEDTGNDLTRGSVASRSTPLLAAMTDAAESRRAHRAAGQAAPQRRSVSAQHGSSQMEVCLDTPVSAERQRVPLQPVLLGERCCSNRRA
ncbi:hypothetical protein TRVL_05718 [Trypanosoma vivax]|nr:hypothetical protein TRVL_05718 [Trypanosoma vivax]